MCYDYEPSDGSTSTASPLRTPLQNASNRKKKSKCPRGPITPKLPKFSGHEEKADFMINVFKVQLCTRRRRHTWSGCPYAHEGETAKRRDPHTYHAVPCPEMKQGTRCPRGDQCPYSHHDFEYWLHPARYCTVMCNKGAHCDRSLCFFAHHPKELRSNSAALPDGMHDERMLATDCQEPIGDISFEKCVEEMKSSPSLTSVADSFRSTYDRFQDTNCCNESATTDVTNDCPPSFFLNHIPTNMPPDAFIKKPSPCTTAKPSVATDLCASADICHLLNQSRGMEMHQLPSHLLQKSFSVGQASTLAPSHFSGLPGEFMTSTGIRTLPSCPAAFDLIDVNAVNRRSHGYRVPVSTSDGTFSQACPLKSSPYSYAQLTPNPSPGHITNQAMDSLPSLSQGELLAQTTSLSTFGSTSSLLGSPGSDVLSNDELLQLLQLQLLHNVQAVHSQPSSTPTVPCGLLHGSPGLLRDQLYSAHQSGLRSLVQGHGFFP